MLWPYIPIVLQNFNISKMSYKASLKVLATCGQNRWCLRGPSEMLIFGPVRMWIGTLSGWILKSKEAYLIHLQWDVLLSDVTGFNPHHKITKMAAQCLHSFLNNGVNLSPSVLDRYVHLYFIYNTFIQHTQSTELVSCS